MHVLKKAISTFMTMIMTMTMFGSLIHQAAAMDLSQAYEVSGDYTLNDENGKVFEYYIGLRKEDNPYGYAVKEMRRTIHDYTVKRKGLTGNRSDWTYNTDYLYAFCIEMGIPIKDKLEYTGSSDENHGNKWAAMSPEQRDLIMLALSYGYTNRTDLITSKDANACYAATQLIVWQISLGFRTSPTHLEDRTYPMDGHTGTMTEQLCENAHFKRYYDRILEDMQRHNITPSFTGTELNAPVYELTPSGGQYKLVLTDTNGVLSDFYISSAPGNLSTNINGNELTITSSTPIKSDIELSLTRRMPSTTNTTGFLIWSVPDKEGENQDMVTGVDSDPQVRYLKLKASTGNLNIIKTTQHNNGSVSGFKFEVRNSSGDLVGTYTSSNSGKIDIPDLAAGIYTVKEVDLSSDFVAPTPNPISVEVKPGQTASVSFDNVRKRGILIVQKTNANPIMGEYSLEGAEFEVRDQGGNLVDTIIVDKSGRGSSKILPLGVYRIQESKSPYGFVRDKNVYTATLSGTQGNEAIVYSPHTFVAEQPQVGKINIAKYNQNPEMGDYDLAGAVFEILDGNTVVDTVVVNSEGKGQSKSLPLKSYVVREKSAPYGFTLNTKSYPVTLEYSGQEESVVYETVNIPQQPKVGRIRIHKVNTSPSMGEYSLKGATFEIRNKATGDLVDTVTVDSSGFAQSKELPLNSYIVSEKSAPYGFTLNSTVFDVALTYSGQEATVTYSDVTIPETPQVGTITVKKLDAETGETAQGDSTLAGAVFEIWNEDKSEILDTLYCGSNTEATSKELPLGNYFYREKTPPTGYNHDPSYHSVTIEYQGQNVSVVKKYGSAENKVIQGKIALTKHTDEPDGTVHPSNPQIEQPLEGAVFQIYLKSAGSYKKAKDTERDQLTTNRDGYCESKPLPYGWYTVEEIFSPEDTKLVEPFDIFVNEEGKIYRYIANNTYFRSLVKVIKVDSETGKTIPAAGVTFKIWDVEANSWITQTINYPTLTVLDEFQTASDGTLVLPEPLKSGEYLLYETSGCYGYVLAEEPVAFTIHSSQQSEIIEVMMANAPAKGTILIEKTGDMLTGAQKVKTEYGTQYVPIFEQVPVSGQQFDIIAASDVYTPDGTLRFCKDTIVDTISIIDGKGESKQLYLGDYFVVEKKAGEPFVKNPKKYPVSLQYEGENVPVVHTSLSMTNERQRVEIEVIKLIEKLEDAPEGFSPYNDVLLGLYAESDILDVNGNVVVPKDGLLSLITVNAEGRGFVSGKLPFSELYIREIKTNSYYELNQKKYPVAVRYQGEDVQTAKIVLEQAIPNELKPGRITLYKQGEMLTGAVQKEQEGYVLYTPVYELAGLSGAVFDILADEDIYDIFGNLIYGKDTVVDTLTTGSDGWASSKLLHPGKFRVVEKSVGEGFVRDNNPVYITLGFGSEVTDIITEQVSVDNRRQKAQINLTKSCELPENTPDHFNPYADILFGIYADEDIKGNDGSIAIPKDALLELVSIPASGTATLKKEYPLAKYYAKELSCMDGYLLLKDKYKFQFDYQGPDTSIVQISIGGKGIENKLQRGSLKIKKTFEGRDIPLEGVPFRITGETTVGTKVTIDVKTDKNGEVLLEGLLVGNYKIQELESELTAGYVLSEEQTTVVAPDKLTEMEIPNKLQRGSLKIIKTFEGKDVPIEGVPFRITGDTVVGEKVVIKAETDSNGKIILEDLLMGSYRIQELDSELTVGYVLSEEQTTIVAPDQLSELSIHNELQYGSLKLIKTFEGQEKPIAGVPFHIFGTSLAGMEYDEVLKTNDNGEIFVRLPVGEYRVEELPSDKTEGYKLLDAQTIIIKYDDTKEFDMENKLIRGDVKLIKVGENGERLAGAVFDLYNPAGEKLGEYQCDENGEIQVKGLPYGKGYKWVETAAPAGYTGAGTEYVFDISEENTTVEVSAMNVRIPQTGDNGAEHYMVVFLLSLAALITTAAFGRRNRVKRSQNK